MKLDFVARGRPTEPVPVYNKPALESGFDIPGLRCASSGYLYYHYFTGAVMPVDTGIQ